MNYRLPYDYKKGGFDSYVFLTLVMDKLSRKLYDEVHWRMLFAVVIVLVDEIVKGLSTKIDNWIETIEKGFR